MKLFLKIFIPVAGAVILAFILSVSIRANGGITEHGVQIVGVLATPSMRAGRARRAR